jgi:hypothetical protein
MYKPIDTRVTVHKKYADPPKPTIQHGEHWGVESSLAAVLVERWGMVAAVEDGEDSAGRARLRLATPEEVVARAVKCATLLVDECRSRGLMVEVPLGLVAVEDEAAG